MTRRVKTKDMAEEAMAGLRRAARTMSPRAMFRLMVDRGLINNEGRVTRLYGGTAEPEPRPCYVCGGTIGDSDDWAMHLSAHGD